MKTPRNYTIELRENGERLSVQKIEDPFIRTSIRPRGPKSALAVLRGRYVVEVLVNADRETIAHVMSGADPKVPGGVARRTA